MKPDLIARVARTLRDLLAEHRGEFDARSGQHIATVTTNEADAERLKRGVDEAVAAHARRRRADQST